MKPEDICKTPRYRALERLTSYLESTQYKGRPDWWSGQKPNGEVVPLRERAPCIVYPLPKASVDQLTRFCFGVDKWPSIRIDDERIAESEREAASSTLEAMNDQCGVKVAIRACMAKALATGTAVAVIGLRRGRIVIETPRPQDCWPTFEDDDPNAPVTSLTWCYQFDKTVQGDNGPEVKRHWFRRDIDAGTVTQYLDAEVVPNEAPVWKVDAARSYAHGFGFCPVLWMRNMPDCAHGDIDGTSLYGGLLDEFDALNFALSQRHRGIHYFGTPQRYETGVGDDEEPADMGRSAHHDIPGYSAGKASAGPHGSTAPKVRRLAPDGVWSYKSPEADVGIVETTGKAFEVTSLHVDDVRSRVLESMGVVLINQSNILGGPGGSKEMSGRFLRLAFGPMLNLVDELRESCWWPHLQAMIGMVLRIVATRSPGEVVMPCAADVAALGKKLLATDAPIALSPMWGDAFELSPDEAKMSAEAASKAHAAKLISDETATRYVAGPFGVSDVAAERKVIDEKAEEEAAAALEMATALGDPGDDEATHETPGEPAVAPTEDER